jgi:hypothetical protein
MEHPEENAEPDEREEAEDEDPYDDPDYTGEAPGGNLKGG